MTQREMNKLDHDEKQRAIREASGDVIAALNPDGATADEIRDCTDADRASEIAKNLTTPTCRCRRGATGCEGESGHEYPAWYCRDAGPAVRTWLRVLTQYERSL